MVKDEFSKYERARILGARSLQISMDAPVLAKMSKEELQELSYDSLKIAQKELDSGILPIGVHRPTPIKRDSKLRELKVDELEREESENTRSSKNSADIVELKDQEELDEGMEEREGVSISDEEEDLDG